jgi:hypothetical protein
VKRGDNLKKLTILAALLAMLLIASAPLVLAQQTPAPAPPPVPDPGPVPPPDSTGFMVGCQILFNDPEALCPVDENGLITRPDGTKAPVVVEPDGTAFIVEEDGTLTTIGQGPSLMPDEDTGGGIQYDNAQGEPPPPPPVLSP